MCPGTGRACADRPHSFHPRTHALAYLAQINFNTAYFEGRELVSDRARIAKNYCNPRSGGWFWIDLACVIPFDMIAGDDFRVIKVLKLVRLLKVMKFVDKFEEEGCVTCG